MRSFGELLGMAEGAARVLCCLRCAPELRLVHQRADVQRPGVHGESVFFRRPNPLGIKPPGGLNTLGRLLRGRWIAEAPEYGISFQGEYQLSADALAAFERNPDWAEAEELWREVLNLPRPPKLTLIDGGRA